MSFIAHSAPVDHAATLLPVITRLERRLSRAERRASHLRRELRSTRRTLRRVRVRVALPPPTGTTTTSRSAAAGAAPELPAWGGAITSVRAGLLCIHSHEGAWNANTGNGYHGGLQMDRSFEEAYGAEFLAEYGDAENWPVEDQMIAGERGYAARGWSPWPNTAAMCGLLP